MSKKKNIKKKNTITFLKTFLLIYEITNIIYLIISLFMHTTCLLAYNFNFNIYGRVIHWIILFLDCGYIILQIFEILSYIYVYKKLKIYLGPKVIFFDYFFYFLSLLNFLTILIYLIGTIILSIYWESYSKSFIDIIGIHCILFTLIRQAFSFFINFYMYLKIKKIL